MAQSMNWCCSLVGGSLFNSRPGKPSYGGCLDFRIRDGNWAASDLGCTVSSSKWTRRGSLLGVDDSKALQLQCVAARDNSRSTSSTAEGERGLSVAETGKDNLKEPDLGFRNFAHSGSSEGRIQSEKTPEGENRVQEGGGGEGESSSAKEEELVVHGFQISRICDRLIEVFLTEKTTPAEWRSLLALSTEWVEIRPHFYKHCKAKAKAETAARKKRELNKLAKQVKEIDDNMIRHDALLAELEKNSFDIDIIVAKRRKDFTGEFFEHLHTLSDVTSRSNRRDEIASIAGKCISLIEAHDAALEDTESITEAQVKFETILSAPSVEAVGNKISQLAKSKELDSTLLLLITKAWAAAQDSTTMKQEVKDIMFYIYKTAKTSMLKLVPDEILIIKHLLSIPDPRDRFEAMTDAFAPGDELEEKNENKFHTSPDKLRHWIKLLLDAYHTNKQSTMIKEAQKLMNPDVISRLEILLEYMDDTFV